MKKDINFAFFGTPEFSVIILDELKAQGFLPKLIVTAPDKPQGRHLVLTPPPAKMWAQAQKILVLQPATLKTPEFVNDLKKFEPTNDFDVFIVASYGKIIPENILDLPRNKTLNVHPSLLPKLRGASPIQTAILEENETGVTIMHLDPQMDHGPIVMQKKVNIPDWPPRATDLEQILAHEGGKLLAEILEPWIRGKIKEIPQDHSLATFCKKINKEDGLIDLSEDPEKNFRKIQAFSEWPRAYFFVTKGDKKIRVIIKDAELVAGELKITRVIPEGKKEMNYDDFIRNL